MNTLVAMRRANGDWFALEDKGRLRVPIFHSEADAMRARSRDSGMECFRPIFLDDAAFKNLITTDEGVACFWVIDDPLRRLSLGRPFDHDQLIQFRDHVVSLAGPGKASK
ncbi:MAG TPA: hypothetical protein VJU86_14580 [Pyrinomonadaceae bacterium]|nr:hypothetical protein [Pyrinomonadaceae bacterium]